MRGSGCRLRTIHPGAPGDHRIPDIGLDVEQGRAVDDIHVIDLRLGMNRTWRMPEWFMEGMAYALSDDPRPTLSEPFERYRVRFARWYEQVGQDRLWIEARHR